MKKNIRFLKSYQTFTAKLLGEKKQLREVVAPLKRFVRPPIRSTENLEFDPKNWLRGPLPPDTQHWTLEGKTR